MVGWFGKSWGAPCCDPEEHVPTPVGEACLRCGERIAKDDQGVTMWHVQSFDPPVACVRAHHLDCYLKTILPHGPDCVHCRGMQREEHAVGCAYLSSDGGDCTCFRR